MHLNKKVQRAQSADTNIVRLLIPSILGILLCVVCLLGSTFAWFSATSTATAETIQAANYTVNVLSFENETGEAIEANNGIYALTAGTYKITLKADGTATSGFCIFRFWDADTYEDVHTAQIGQGEAVVWLKIEKDSETLQIIPHWGTSAATEHISFSEPYIRN